MWIKGDGNEGEVMGREGGQGGKREGSGRGVVTVWPVMINSGSKSFALHAQNVKANIIFSRGRRARGDGG